MYKVLIICFVSLFCACQQNSDTKQKQVPTSPKNEIPKDFQSILDSFQVTGAILIFDERENTYYSNDFAYAKKGFLPASTFKIPNTLIGLETGAINEQTIFKWNGEKRFLKRWEKDMNLQEAFQESCVPCYQETARKIGIDSMRYYLDHMPFGNMVVDSTNLDQFWLEGDSRITPIQQIEFLTSLHNLNLPLISDSTLNTLKKIMILEKRGDYILRGKTGWSVDGNQNIGWFVGIEERKEKIYYIATNVEPKENFNMSNFGWIRFQISKEALSKMNTSIKL